MFEEDLKHIETHLRDGSYAADVRALRAIYALLEEVKRLRNESAHFRQLNAAPGRR